MTIAVRAASACAMLIITLAAPSVRAADAPDGTRIAAARSPISIVGGRLAGAGGEVLRDAFASSQFVLLGEEHGTAEIPRFAGAVFDALAPLGYRTIAVETGPVLTRHLRGWIADPNGTKAFSTFERRFPGTTAFYSWSDEFAFLAGAARRVPGLRLWGLDQELMGAPGFLFAEMLARHPGRRSRALIAAMNAENDADYAHASQTGAPPDAYLMRVPRADLVRLQRSLATDGDAEARRLAASLLATHDIYVDCCNDKANESNRNRAILMKRTLHDYIGAAPLPKVLFKFGEEHLYRGLNPVNNYDLGNHLYELGDTDGLKSVGILALGVSGTKTVFGGFGKPWRTAPSDTIGDPRFAYLAPFIAAMYPQGWTLYDLRSFRSHFNGVGIADRNFRMLTYGYDFLLLIPNVTPDSAIDPTVF
jgi:hypothetical protein